MMDKKQSVSFHKLEKYSEYIYILVCLITIFGNISPLFGQPEIQYNMYIIIDTVSFLGLSFLYCSLTRLVKKYHPKRYDKIIT